MRRLPLIVATALLLGSLTSCKTDRYGRYEGNGRYPAYLGGAYGHPGIGGSGARYLDPWLAETPVGQRLIAAHFDRNHNGEIGSDRAAEANAWFRRFADTNLDLRLTDAEIDRGLMRLDRVLRREGY